MSGAGTTFALEDALIGGTRPWAGNPPVGRGLVVEQGATARIDDVVVDGSQESGVVVYDPTTVFEAHHMVISRTQAVCPSPPPPPGVCELRFGEGLVVGYGATPLVAESAIVSNHHIGVACYDGLPTIRRSLVAWTEALPDGTGGFGMSVKPPGGLMVESSAIVGNRTIGIGVFDKGASLVATGSLIAGTEPPPGATGPSGYGVLVFGGGSVELTGCALVGNHFAGVSAEDDGTLLVARDTVVASTAPMTFPGGGASGGAGISVIGGACAVLERNAVVGNTEAGLMASGISMTANGTVIVGKDASVEATDNLFALTRPSPAPGREAAGVGVDAEIEVTLTGNALTGNHARGLSVTGDRSVTVATGNVIAGNALEASDYLGVRAGVFANGAARLTLEGSAVVDNGGGALRVANPRTRVTARGNVLGWSVPAPGLESTSLGYGCVIDDHASAELEGNAIVDNRVFGISVAAPVKEVTLTGNLVAGTWPRISDGVGGWGLAVGGGPSAEAAVVATGNSFVRNRVSGISVAGQGASLRASGNLVASSTSAGSSSPVAWGVSVDLGATATLLGNALVGNESGGLFAAESTVEANENLVTARIGGAIVDTGFAGIFGGNGAVIELARNAVVDSREFGVFGFAAGTTIGSTGDLVRDTLPGAAEGLHGAGYWLQEGASATLEGSVATGHHVAAVMVLLGADVTVTGSRLAGTAEGRVPERSTADLADGLSCFDATLHADGAVAEDNVRAGIAAWNCDGTVEASVARRNAIGLSIHGDPELQVDGLSQVFDNTTTDRSTDLLPMATEPTEPPPKPTAPGSPKDP